ncbi:restriction endonuclease subunit S [Enterococcus faecium]|uniref:restriction endonuclease subunit S n=1 Tax=Enterococcus faecium TaxID=1352 RepID=UPI002073CFF8|nr:restriction endonuclease subunit S [Enterococcus faecium]MCM6878335.1 restriction endonuclease subunit S [Enterococcus faecium]
MSNDTQPEIRFPGFTEDWEQRKLGDITESFSGGTPTAGKSEYYGGDIPFIRSGEISSELTELFITENGLNNSSAKMVKAGDILYALYGATSGEVSISRINGAINQAILAIRPTKNDNSYLIVQWLRKQKDTIISTYLQGGQGNLSGSIVKDLVITLPQDKEEQNKIGAFFKQLDDTIALHQRKLDLLKETKKGFLQKMFPKNGAKVPEIRFPGFTENWEEKKFKEVINSGIKGKAKAEMSGTKSLYLDTNYLNGGVVTYVDSPRDVENDDVLILWDGSQAGTVYYGFSGALGSTLKAYRAKESGAFLYQQLKRNQQIIYDRYRTPNIPHVVKTFTDEFMVSMPSSEEQNKIGAFFKQLDDTIALHQRKLDLLKETKKGFLQKMFV